MRHNALEPLKRWKSNEDRKPMVLKGARQVGKTWQGKQRICFKPPAELEVLPIPPPPGPAANILRLAEYMEKLC